MGLLDFILQECMDWLHDAHRVVWTVLMLLLLAFLGGCTAILFLARHWGGGVFLGVLTLIYLAFLIHGLAAKPKPSQRGWNSYFRHVRMDGTHTGKLSAESVRGRKAECAVQRSILSKRGSCAERVQWTKQRRRGWRSAPVFASAHRDAPRKPAKRKRARGEGISVLRSRQKWVPPGAWRFCDTLKNGPAAKLVRFYVRFYFSCSGRSVPAGCSPSSGSSSWLMTESISPNLAHSSGEKRSRMRATALWTRSPAPQ